MDPIERSDSGLRFVETLAQAAKSSQCARLTDQQFAGFQQLREAVERHYSAGRLDEARLAFDLALALLKEGPPTLG